MVRRQLLFLMTLAWPWRWTRAEDLAEVVASAEAIPLRPWQGMVLPAQFAVLQPAALEPDGARRSVIVEIESGVPQAWNVMVSRSFTEPLLEGRVCLYTIRARLLGTAEPAKSGRLDLKVQANISPYVGVGGGSFRPGPTWQKYLIPFRVKAAVPEGKGAAALIVGGRAQTLELGRAELYQFPADFDITRLTALPNTLPADGP
jgi:hypothetical protein